MKQRLPLKVPHSLGGKRVFGNYAKMKSIYRIRNDNGHPEPLVRNWMLFSEEKKEKKGFSERKWLSEKVAIWL